MARRNVSLMTSSKLPSNLTPLPLQARRYLLQWLPWLLFLLGVGVWSLIDAGRQQPHYWGVALIAVGVGALLAVRALPVMKRALENGAMRTITEGRTTRLEKPLRVLSFVLLVSTAFLFFSAWIALDEPPFLTWLFDHFGETLLAVIFIVGWIGLISLVCLLVLGLIALIVRDIQGDREMRTQPRFEIRRVISNLIVIVFGILIARVLGWSRQSGHALVALAFVAGLVGFFSVVIFELLRQW